MAPAAAPALELVMLEPSNGEFTYTRMEVTSLGFHNMDKGIPNSPKDFDDDAELGLEDKPNDIQGSCRILISDGTHVREIYNPEKLKSLKFTDLPSGFQNSAKRRRQDGNSIIHTELPPLLKMAQYQHSGGSPNPQLWDSITRFSRGKCRDLGNSLKQIQECKEGPFIDLPVTGPSDLSLDIQPFCNYFNLIVHQDTCDEKLLEKNTFKYRAGCVPERGTVKSYSCKVRTFKYDRPLKCKFFDALFSLTLDCIVFSDSKLVTVKVWWLMEEEIGGDGEKTQATHEAYIRGKLYLHSMAFDTTSVLLETPGDQVIKVEHGKPIQLLKSVVVVPFMSSFKVVADLLDPINNSSVNDSTASFDQSEENIPYKFNGCILGKGATIKVEVNMEPNDLVREYPWLTDLP